MPKVIFFLCAVGLTFAAFMAKERNARIAASAVLIHLIAMLQLFHIYFGEVP